MSPLFDFVQRWSWVVTAAIVLAIVVAVVGLAIEWARTVRLPRWLNAAYLPPDLRRLADFHEDLHIRLRFMGIGWGDVALYVVLRDYTREAAREPETSQAVADSVVGEKRLVTEPLAKTKASDLSAANPDDGRV